MADHRSLSRLLAWIAHDLDGRHYPYAGPLREAARTLATLPDLDPDGCRGCGQPLTQPATGRRREWCDEACRKRTARR